MVKWWCFYHLRINGRNSPSKYWEVEDFSVLFLFFHLSLPKIWQAHQHKIFIFEINKDGSVTSQSLGP